MKAASPRECAFVGVIHAGYGNTNKGQGVVVSVYFQNSHQDFETAELPLFAGAVSADGLPDSLLKSGGNVLVPSI